MVTAEANLTIAKTGSPNPVDAGKPLQYTVTVGDTGPSDASDVVVTDTLPAGVVYASSTLPASVSGGVVTVDLGTLTAGAPAASFVITVDVDSTTVGSITNNATATSTDAPSVSASCTTTVNQPIHPSGWQLTILKQASVSTVSVGGTLIYTLTVTYNDHGDTTHADDTGVTVSDALPTGETLASSVSSSQGTASVVGNQITVNLGTIASGGSATITVPVRITSSVSSVTNTAIATDNLEDQVQSSVTTQVLSSPSKRMFLGR